MNGNGLTFMQCYERYLSGYGPNCGFTLEEWFEYRDIVRKNKIKLTKAKKKIDKRKKDQ